jgi:hypothetical protein
VIGGVLTSNFLCKRCNDILGAHESDLKKDPAWRLAIEKLKGQIPRLWESTLRTQTFMGQSGAGPTEGYYRKKESSGELDFRVKRAKVPDGSLVLPNDDARKSVSKMLAKEGFAEAEIDQALRQFDVAPENTRVTIAAGFDIVKWTVTRVDPTLDGRLLLVQLTEDGDEVLAGAGIVLLKIAFEYVALHVGPTVFHPVFDPIRDALSHNAASRCPHWVEWKLGPKLEPFYGLLIERMPSYIVVQIRFFGELVYRVHFPHLRPGEAFQRCRYTHDLLAGTEDLREA